jgi:hypothetical protein
MCTDWFSIVTERNRTLKQAISWASKPDIKSSPCWTLCERPDVVGQELFDKPDGYYIPCPLMKKSRRYFIFILCRRPRPARVSALTDPIYTLHCLTSNIRHYWGRSMDDMEMEWGPAIMQTWSERRGVREQFKPKRARLLTSTYGDPLLYRVRLRGPIKGPLGSYFLERSMNWKLMIHGKYVYLYS